MANIGTYLAQILSARYGKDVRKSIHDSIKEINDIATTAQNSATASANTAVEKASEAVIASENATAKAEEAKTYANQALSTTPDGYNQMVTDVDLLKNSIVQTADRTLYGSKAGGIKLIGIEGASEQGENPSPDNPQEIESVGDSGSLTIKAEGKNQLPPREGVTSNGITYSVDNRGVVTANGATTNADSYEFAYFSNKTALPDWLETGVEYIATCNSSDSKLLLQCYYYKEDGSAIGVVDTSTSASFTIPETAVGLILRLYVGRNVTLTNAKAYPMIRKADIEDSTFEPYRSKSITIPLSEPLREGDEIAVVDGVWGINRGRAKEVYDGSPDEEWSNHTIDTRLQISPPQNALSGGTLLCNRASFTTVQASAMANNTVKISDYLYIKDERYTSVDDFKADLASSPMIVEYNLATPIFEPFTDQTPFYGLESFDTVTYISTDSEIEPTVILKFAKTEGDAVTLLNYNQTNLNRIAIAELTSAVLALNQE